MTKAIKGRAEQTKQTLEESWTSAEGSNPQGLSLRERRLAMMQKGRPNPE